MRQAIRVTLRATVGALTQVGSGGQATAGLVAGPPVLDDRVLLPEVGDRREPGVAGHAGDSLGGASSTPSAERRRGMGGGAAQC